MDTPYSTTGRQILISELQFLRPFSLLEFEYLRDEGTLLSFDKLKSLTEGSLIRIPKKDERSSETYVEVTHVYETTVGAMLSDETSGFYRSQLQNSAGREIAETDKLTVYEIYEVILPFEGNYLSYMEHSLGW